jgi:hypothetical protein
MSFIVFSGIMGAAACNTAASYHKNRSHADVKDADIARGEVLAVKYCQSCHMLPSPGLLDAVTWEKGVLPAMAPRLAVSPKEWEDIITYYTALAPDSLVAPPRSEALVRDTARFRVVLPKMVVSGGASVAMPGDGGATRSADGLGDGGASPPATCFIQYDSGLHQVLTSDILTHAFSRWDRELRPLPGATIAGSVVSMIQSPAERLVCNIGAFQPNNAKAGSVERWVPGAMSAVPVFVDVSRDLIRPVHIAEADLNGDGRKDIVVCEFGYIKGMLSWLESRGDGSYEKHVLRDMPGAIRAVIDDYNHDGLPDIWVLFAQGEEGIFLYTNKGRGQFAEREVLRFPPSYGSSYFELTDLNGDGRKDILYTCGDNGDFSTVLKPYHGVYVFVNEGAGSADSAARFTQRYFFPLNGAYRAMSVDLDKDGLPDIAAIAYFADYSHHPEEGFVYLRNKGGLHFDAHTVPGTEAGRWITMDVGDVDGDGWPDVLLANCSVGPVFNKGLVDWKKGPPFVVLKNIGAK